jgi:hypothetical protein
LSSSAMTLTGRFRNAKLRTRCWKLTVSNTWPTSTVAVTLALWFPSSVLPHLSQWRRT